VLHEETARHTITSHILPPALFRQQNTRAPPFRPVICVAPTITNPLHLPFSGDKLVLTSSGPLTFPHGLGRSRLETLPRLLRYLNRSLTKNFLASLHKHVSKVTIPTQIMCITHTTPPPPPPPPPPTTNQNPPTQQRRCLSFFSLLSDFNIVLSFHLSWKTLLIAATRTFFCFLFFTMVNNAFYSLWNPQTEIMCLSSHTTTGPMFVLFCFRLVRVRTVPGFCSPPPQNPFVYFQGPCFFLYYMLRPLRSMAATFMGELTYIRLRGLLFRIVGFVFFFQRVSPHQIPQFLVLTLSITIFPHTSFHS